MNLLRPDRQPRISLIDFEEMLLNRPEHEKWELIDGRVIKSMVGARWEHHRIISNVDFALQSHLRGRKAPCHWHGDPPLERLDQSLALPEIEFALSLADIYRDVAAAS